jgi:hypothetical protein
MEANPRQKTLSLRQIYDMVKMVLGNQYVPSWFCDVLSILSERQPDVRYYANGDFPFNELWIGWLKIF